MTEPGDLIVDRDDLLLVTGASGFIGARVVSSLLTNGYHRLRCLVRPSSDLSKLQEIVTPYQATVEIIHGNLLDPSVCARLVDGVSIIYHLAAGRGEKSYADAFLNTVVTTRNLLEAARLNKGLKRVVNVSSFSVYTNRNNPQGRLLDETSPTETHPERRGDAYTYAKTKQEKILEQYSQQYKIPYVIVRPGVVYGPGNEQIHGRIGLATFGIFLHTGGENPVPLTFVDNCADAIRLAGTKAGVDGEVFNVVDDDLPSSRAFLKLYKENVRRFRSIYLPHAVSYLLCWTWESYATWSRGQLPPVFSRATWWTYWKQSKYTNGKLKSRLGWAPKVSMAEGLQSYFESCRRKLARG